jgi:hypothetical protein
MIRAILAVVFGVAVGVFIVAPLASAHSATGQVSVAAEVRTTVLLDITTPGSAQSVDFGVVDPGVATPAQTVGIVVRSNRPYSLVKSASGGALLGLSTSLSASTGNPKTNAAAFSDDYTLDVPETTDPGAYSASVQYTVVQE